MDDKEFLECIYRRLVHEHGAHPYFDYMQRLRAIIDATPEGRVTPAQYPDDTHA